MQNFLLEVSWEVANKVGGIYTVLKDKARYLKEKFGDDYLVIGPYLPEKGFQDFYQFVPNNDLGTIIAATEKYGIKVYYGEWLIEGRPKGFLIDFENLKSKANVFKYELWEKYKIDSTKTADDYNNPILWSKATSVFLKIFCDYFSNQKIVVHFHEWLSGAAILFGDFMRAGNDNRIKTIFTIHATVLGRSLSSSGNNFWEHLNSINPDNEAKKIGIEAKHAIEKFASQKAFYFTAVSNILGLEAEKFLDRKIDFILPNGLDFNRFPALEEVSYLHRKNREILKDFALFFFAPYYRVDIKNSLIMFISARPEIKNKGIDIFIKSLGKLNQILESDSPNVFVFIFVPGEVSDENHILKENLNIYKRVEDKIDDMNNELKGRLINYLIHKKEISTGGLFTNEEFLEFKKMFNKVKRELTIPVSTHILKNNNPIIKLLKESNLSNRIIDRVKIIYYPIYLSSSDGLLNLNYEDAIAGSHIGVLPSYYEPWGYTALETAASAVLTITSDLSGFENYLKQNTKTNQETPGIFTLARNNKKDEEVIDDLTKLLQNILKLDVKERIKNNFEARRLAEICNWKNLIKNYYNLYNQAFNN